MDKFLKELHMGGGMLSSLASFKAFAAMYFKSAGPKSQNVVIKGSALACV